MHLWLCSALSCRKGFWLLRKPQDVSPDAIVMTPGPALLCCPGCSMSMAHTSPTPQPQHLHLMMIPPSSHPRGSPLGGSFAGTPWKEPHWRAVTGIGQTSPNGASPHPGKYFLLRLTCLVLLISLLPCLSGPERLALSMQQCPTFHTPS